MTQPPPLNAKVQDQVDHIRNAFSTAANPVTIEVIPDNNGGVAYMYADDEILVREEDLPIVRGILGATSLPQPEPVIKGIKRHKLAGTRYNTVSDALDAIDTQHGRIAATPNHVLTVAGVAGPCPATEPVQVYDGIEPYPAARASGGAGVLIYVADTGLLQNADLNFAWLEGVQRAFVPPGPGSQGVGTLPLVLQGYDALGPPRPSSSRASSSGASSSGASSSGAPAIEPYTGHGTFVAGVTRCVAPQADVIVSNVFKTAGSALESDFVQELDEALDLGVDIFNLSVTVPTRSNRPLVAFQRWLARLSQYKGVVCVAAAGNSSTRAPYWPAAFPEVVSVGALAADWRSRAAFSNYGGWVDVYAPGRDIVNAFATGEYVCADAPYKGQVRHFYGMAQWSGTSFSTPIVTGLIAARMSRTGESGKEAAAALLAEAHAQAVPGVGAILLPYGNKFDD